MNIQTLQKTGKLKTVVNVLMAFFILAGLTVFIPSVRQTALATVGNMMARLGKAQNDDVVNNFRMIWLGLTLLISCGLFVTYINCNSDEAVRKASLAICAITTCTVTVLIMYHANWTMGDDHEFLNSLCLGKLKPVHVEHGRLFGHYEYNILLLTPFFDNAVAYYLINAVEYVIFSVCFFHVIKYAVSGYFKTVNRLSYCIITFWYICMNGLFCKVFMDLVFSDKTLIVLIAIMVVFLIKGMESGKKGFYIYALLTAICATYFKEPVFGSLLVLSIAILLIKRKKISSGELIFCIGLVINAVIYVILYYNISLKNAADGLYGGGGTNSLAASPVKALVQMYKQNAFLMVITILSVVKVIKYIASLRKSGADSQLTVFDALLLAGCSYFFAYYLLRMTSEHYLLPCLAFAFPAIIIDLNNFFTRKNIWKKIIPVLCMLFLLPVLYHVINRAGTNIYHKNHCFAECQNIAELNEPGARFYWYDEGGGYIRWYTIAVSAAANYHHQDNPVNFITMSTLKPELEVDEYVFCTNPIREYKDSEDIEEIKNLHFYMYKRSVR